MRKSVLNPLAGTIAIARCGRGDPPRPAPAPGKNYLRGYVVLVLRIHAALGLRCRFHMLESIDYFCKSRFSVFEIEMRILDKLLNAISRMINAVEPSYLVISSRK